jgi:spore germination cell wall hydrolase CwlJ-like protein
MTPLMCLAVAIFFEARGEVEDGQYAVGQVVINRVEDPRYPDRICDVVFEGKQFSFTHDGNPSRLPAEPTAASEKALEVADNLIGGASYPINATHYHAPSVEPYWAEEYDREGRIGDHIFYVNNTPHR